MQALGYTLLTEDDVLDGVSALVPRIEVEALFDDGMRLLVLHEPLVLDAPPQPSVVSPTWDTDGVTELDVTNEGEVLIAVTSHFHVFEASRDLRFDRSAAWGMRLAIRAGEKVVFAPEATVSVRLRPIGGARLVRGHGGLCDGPLDEQGARERALGLARERGYRGA